MKINHLFISIQLLFQNEYDVNIQSHTQRAHIYHSLNLRKMYIRMKWRKSMLKRVRIPYSVHTQNKVYVHHRKEVYCTEES